MKVQSNPNVNFGAIKVYTATKSIKGDQLPKTLEVFQLRADSSKDLHFAKTLLEIINKGKKYIQLKGDLGNGLSLESFLKSFVNDVAHSIRTKDYFIAIEDSENIAGQYVSNYSFKKMEKNFKFKHTKIDYNYVDTTDFARDMTLYSLLSDSIGGKQDRLILNEEALLPLFGKVKRHLAMDSSSISYCKNLLDKRYKNQAAKMGYTMQTVDLLDYMNVDLYSLPKD